MKDKHAHNELFYALSQTLARDLRIAMRQLQESAKPMIFFILVLSLFPLAISPESKFLMRIAPGVIWVAALLASFLSLDRLFGHDYADGSLEHLLLAPQPLPMLILAKVVAHWLLTGVPLLLVTPLVAMMYSLPAHNLSILLLGLLLGTPVLSLIGAIGSALTVGLRSGGILLALIVLPLYVPVLIFGCGLVVSYSQGFAISGEVALLAAFLVLAITLAPIAAAAAIRVAMSY